MEPISNVNYFVFLSKGISRPSPRSRRSLRWRPSTGCTPCSSATASSPTSAAPPSSSSCRRPRDSRSPSSPRSGAAPATTRRVREQFQSQLQSEFRQSVWYDLISHAFVIKKIPKNAQNGDWNVLSKKAQVDPTAFDLDPGGGGGPGKGGGGILVVRSCPNFSVKLTEDEVKAEISEEKAPMIV